MTNTSILFSEYRRRVLALLLLHPESQYHVREIARYTGTEAGSLHRELLKLATAQVLIRERSGNQVYYQANPSYPLFDELVSILKKTTGLTDVLRDCLAPLVKKIEVAFVFGSVARNTENPASDIDILIVGELDYAEAVTVLHPAQDMLKREINPKIYSNKEWQKSLKAGEAFLREILNNPKIFIIGDKNDLK